MLTLKTASEVHAETVSACNDANPKAEVTQLFYSGTAHGRNGQLVVE